MKYSVSAFLALVPVLTIVAATPAEKSAEAAARQYADCFKSGRVAEAYAMLPASYQKDIVTVATSFGAKMDPEIWSEACGIVGTLADVALAKADLVTAMILEKTPTASKTEVSGAVVKSATALKSLSAKLTLDMIKSGNIKKIVSLPEMSAVGAVSKLAGEADDTAAVIGAKELADGSVKVSFKNAKGVVEETPFVKVEGSWVPKDMADGWKEGVTEAKKNIGSMKIDANMKQQLLSMSPMIKMGLAGAKNATTKEQFQQSLMMPFFTVMMTMGSQGGGDAGASPLPMMQ